MVTAMKNKSKIGFVLMWGAVILFYPVVQV